MTLPRAIPMRPVNGFSFLSEVDFEEYRKRLTRFVGEEGYEPPKPDDHTNSIPRVIGFLDELAAVHEVLTSAEMDGVCIVGDEGVGKSALLLSLLNKASLGELSPALLQKCFFVFNIHAFFKLQVPDQIKQFDDAIEGIAKRDSLIIIDRFDDFVITAGPDRSRRFMSTLIDGTENDGLSAIVCAQPRNMDAIAATSTMFRRCFEEIKVGERTADEARNILRQAAPGLERKHRVVIGDDAITEIVRLDQRYDGRLQGKSPTRLIEFIDRLSASVNIAKYGKPIELIRQEMELAELRSEQTALVASAKPSAKRLQEVNSGITTLYHVIVPQQQAWETKFGAIRKGRASWIEAKAMLSPLQDKYDAHAADKDKPALTDAEARSREFCLKAEKQLRTDLFNMEKGVYAESPRVTVADVRTRFAKATGLGSADDEASRLMSLETVLERNVFGQGPAIHTLANAYRIREAGTSDPTRPAAVVMLVGATGCGKTEVMKRLGEFDGNPLINYNMGDFIDKSAVSKLVGAAPGLVGFGETRTLPSAVRERPKSILLLDEIEKAHPDIYKPLMQIFDQGTINDEYGNSVNFKDTIIAMGSNVLTADDFLVKKDFPSHGAPDDKTIREKLLQKGIFLPEFIGRIDKIIVFNNITADVANMILLKNVRDINSGIASKGYEVKLTADVYNLIIDKYFNASQGGRSIKQFSNTILRPMITDRLLSRKASEHGGDDELKTMVLSMVNGEPSIDGVTLDQMEAA